MDVVVGDITVPLLVVSRTGAQRVAIMCNGAVDQERAGGQPVFQRSTWSLAIEHHQIYVHDPATGAPDYLSLAWGHMSRDVWATDAIGEVVRAVAGALGCSSPEHRVYFGSSAGGFMALALLAGDANARALINNAQFDWTRWMATGVNALRHARFGGMLPADIRRHYPLTSNVLNLLADRGAPVRVDYHVNLASVQDRKQDLPTFQAFVRAYPKLSANVRVHEYFNAAAGHNPMPKVDTLHLINAAFDDSTAGSISHGWSAAAKDTPTRVLPEEGHAYPVVHLMARSEHDVTQDPVNVRYTVEPDEPLGLHHDALLMRRPGSDTLVVYLHGMVDRSKHRIPRFERAADLSGLPYHLLFLADPTLDLSPTLRSGWYIGTRDWDATQALGGFVRNTAQKLGATRILFVGSSGGGFAALAMTTYLPGSMALAFSPQTKVTRFAGGAPARALCKAAFSGQSLDDVVREHAPRFDLAALYAGTESGRAWYVQNSGDETRIATHLEPFRERVDSRVEFVLEHHCVGHNPPTPKRIRDWIVFACANFTADPQVFGLGIKPEVRA